MRSFARPEALGRVPSAVVGTLRTIDQAAGWQQSHPNGSSGLDSLVRRARFESVVASNAIEGIAVPKEAADAVLSGRRPPAGRIEFELAGYQAALDDLYQDPLHELSVPRLLGWHRMIMTHLGPSVAGRLKANDNLVVDVLADGERRTRFQPTSARETPAALQDLCERFNETRGRDEHHPLILVAAAVLDFLVIHPFEDGNGRVARLMTTALTDEAGYRIGRYHSVERLIHDRRSEYYQSLHASTVGWHEAEHSIWPWTMFFVDVLHDAYERLEQALAQQSPPAQLKAEIERWILTKAPATFAASAVRAAFPDAASTTVSAALAELRDQGHLTLSGTGRGSRWSRSDKAG